MKALISSLIIYLRISEKFSVILKLVHLIYCWDLQVKTMKFQGEKPTAVQSCVDVTVDLCYDVIKIEKNCATLKDLHLIMSCRIYPAK